jgi:hypothetical protein
MQFHVTPTQLHKMNNFSGSNLLLAPHPSARGEQVSTPCYGTQATQGLFLHRRKIQIHDAYSPLQPEHPIADRG